MNLKRIGFIGLGIMGKPMKAGFELHIYARRKEKVEDLISEGASFHTSINECVTDQDAVITIVGNPEDVEQVYFGSGNILDSAKRGAYLIDMTTSSPATAKRIYKEGIARGFHVMDAPVTGGDVGAKDGTLSILVGGDSEDFEECLPLFRGMGTSINYFGESGFGQQAKLANQIIIAGTISGICEAFTYAHRKGLNLRLLFDSVSKGAAGSSQLTNQGVKIIESDFSPGFLIKHFIKDMRIAKDEAETENLTLTILNETLKHYEKLMDSGCGELGTQALIKYYNGKL